MSWVLVVNWKITVGSELGCFVVNWGFSPCSGSELAFALSKIYLSWWISDPKIDLTQIFSGPLRLEIRDSKSVFEM